MPVYDYICEKGHKTEALRGGEVENIPCPICGVLAHRSAVNRCNGRLIHSQESMGDEYRRYQEASAEIDYISNKFESETNATVPNLGLWQQAKIEAHKRQH